MMEFEFLLNFLWSFKMFLFIKWCWIILKIFVEFLLYVFIFILEIWWLSLCGWMSCGLSCLVERNINVGSICLFLSGFCFGRFFVVVYRKLFCLLLLLLRWRLMSELLILICEIDVLCVLLVFEIRCVFIFKFSENGLFNGIWIVCVVCVWGVVDCVMWWSNIVWIIELFLDLFWLYKIVNGVKVFLKFVWYLKFLINIFIIDLK